MPEQILQYEDLAYKEQITRIHEQASSFLALLEDSPWKFDMNPEVSLRDAAYQAEDMIEFYLLSQIHATSSQSERRIDHVHQVTIANIFESSSLNLIIPTSSRSERRIEHMHHESMLQHGVLQELISQFDSILWLLTPLSVLSYI
ncbi:hypothetical protein ACJIZ3_014050 [Penstemon smallii]|uniref:Uncharacterized protein n=1 Tax=Penstemon smallii TaxID=265156 RepID=A0ABD3RKD2_9LAMI